MLWGTSPVGEQRLQQRESPAAAPQLIPWGSQQLALQHGLNSGPGPCIGRVLPVAQHSWGLEHPCCRGLGSARLGPEGDLEHLRGEVAGPY